MNLSMMVAASDNGVIGINGDLPWHLSADLKRFKRLTMGHHIIMGRKTFDSIGRCLPGRTTVVITRNPAFEFPGIEIANDFRQALEMCKGDEQPFIVGGGQIYRIALPHTQTVFLTRVLTDIEGDVYFPIDQLDSKEWERLEVDGPHLSERENLHFQFETFVRSKVCHS